MRLVLTNQDFILAFGLFIGALYVCYGVRNGLYTLFAKGLGREPDVLKQPIDKHEETRFGYRLMIAFLDPVLSWLAVAIVTAGYVGVLMVDYTPLMHTLIIFLFMVLGHIFPLRLWVRVYRWITRIYFKDKPVMWIGVTVITWLGSLILFYVVFFSFLGLFYPLIELLSTVVSEFSIVLFKQLYIQHIQAFIFMTGLSVLYFMVDMIYNEYKKGIWFDE